MRRLIAAALSAAFLLGIAATPVAAKAQASITAPDGLAYLDEFMPAWEAPRSYDHDRQLLWGRLICFQGDFAVYVQFVNLDDPLWVIGNPPPFKLGPSLAWTGGAATCDITLYTTDYWAQHRRDVASDTFDVGA